MRVATVRRQSRQAIVTRPQGRSARASGIVFRQIRTRRGDRGRVRVDLEIEAARGRRIVAERKLKSRRGGKLSYVHILLAKIIARLGVVAPKEPNLQAIMSSCGGRAPIVKGLYGVAARASH